MPKSLRGAGFAVLLPLLCHCSGQPAAEESAGSPDASLSGDDQHVTPGGDARPASDVPSAVDRLAAADRTPDTSSTPDIAFAPLNCTPDLLVCEDFESGALDPTVWQRTGWPQSAPNQVAIDFDTKQVGRGARSLRFRQLVKEDPVGRAGFIMPAHKLPFTGKTLFVRYLMYIESWTPDRWFPTFFVWNAEAAGGYNHDQTFMMGLVPIGVKHRAVYLPTWGSTIKDVNVVVPLDRWACWEYEFRPDEKRMILSIDDKPVPGFDLSSTADVPANVVLWFGFAEGHPDIVDHPDDGFFDLWIDDIAVSNKRIGCVR